MIGECRAVPTIPTKNLAASRRFYEDVLGLEVHDEDDNLGVSYRCGDGAIYVYETQFAGTAEHTLCSLVSDHVDEDIEELRSRGVRFETYDVPGVEWDGDVATMENQRGVWFKDPDGNILALFERSGVLAHT